MSVGLATPPGKTYLLQKNPLKRSWALAKQLHPVERYMLLKTTQNRLGVGVATPLCKTYLPMKNTSEPVHAIENNAKPVGRLLSKSTLKNVPASKKKKNSQTRLGVSLATLPCKMYLLLEHNSKPAGLCLNNSTV